jgi:hypothetical protein
VAANITAQNAAIRRMIVIGFLPVVARSQDGASS